jgi:hypothetical protein
MSLAVGGLFSGTFPGSIEMAFSRSATLDDSRHLGEGVWLLLCRSALRGIRWAARALASDGADMLLNLGGIAGAELTRHPRAAVAIDWAKLGELDRAWLARELGTRSR